MLRVENVSMIYGNRAVLRDVSINFEEGSIISITGKSGAGKSTLLGILSGLLKPQQGKVFFQGQDIFRWGDFRRARFRSSSMGFIFQFYNLFPDMTAYENILYPASLNRRAPADINREIEELAELLGIHGMLKQYPETLSGGERQRVAIARAIINRPRLILADEPTGNLDDKTTGDIVELFVRLKKERGITIIAATHEGELVEKSDLNYHIEEGVLADVKRGSGQQRNTRSGPKKNLAGSGKKAKPRSS
jgi:ABC-type lipoprotein export system ATPase subunit